MILKNVIVDDRLITNAQIWFKQGQQRYVKTIIKIYLKDLVTGDNISFICEIPCIEKKDPVVYNIGAAMAHDLQSLSDMRIIEHTFMSKPFTVTQQYEICHMLFYTNDLNKDVDNMFLTYIEVIRRQGFLDLSNNIGIGMYKRYAEKNDERTVVSFVSE